MNRADFEITLAKVGDDNVDQYMFGDIDSERAREVVLAITHAAELNNKEVQKLLSFYSDTRKGDAVPADVKQLLQKVRTTVQMGGHTVDF